MNIHDLGELTGPVLLFGGPYSNLQATRALIDVARARGIPPERVICTGDLVAYCGEPAETVATVRAFGCPVVAGNCEKQMAAHAMTCGCGFEAGSACDRLAAGWYAYAGAAIGAEDRTWMGGLPDMIVFRHAGRRCAVIHGGATEISRFIWPVSGDSVFTEEIDRIKALAGDVDMVIGGHCGVAFGRFAGGVEWVNAGVIGMPANDGRAATRYAVLDHGGAELVLLDYDHAAAQAAMAAVGLVQGYDAALLSGWWPSEDVLPDEMRRRFMMPAPEERLG